ncbi:MAG: hypothetical protein QOF89_1401 [Acidobacteriota bacterium]|jgi:hypothetical protein|nr:hypothetical protein [Acidobacteriota bacterium]
MLRRSLVVAGGLSLMAVLAPVRPGRAEPPSEVVVSNFPQVQAVSGRVTISDPIPQTRLETRKALVTTGALSDANHWTESGSIDCSGFTYVTLSLGGALKGAGQAGMVGVVLVPEVPDVLEALRSYGVLQFPLSVEATVLAVPSGLFTRSPRRSGWRFPAIAYSSTTPSRSRPTPPSTPSSARRSSQGKIDH